MTRTTSRTGSTPAVRSTGGLAKRLCSGRTRAGLLSGTHYCCPKKTGLTKCLFSETAPREGTLQVFPNVYLSNAYTILRPFFRQIPGTEDPLDPNNWEYGEYSSLLPASRPMLTVQPDISSSDFPGVYSTGSGFRGPWPNTKTHPHMKLEQTMVSVPKVYPGDMVFWHCVRPTSPAPLQALTLVLFRTSYTQSRRSTPGSTTPPVSITLIARSVRQSDAPSPQ